MRDPTRQAVRLMTIRLRYTINTLLEDLGLPIRALVERPEVLAPAARLSPAQRPGNQHQRVLPGPRLGGPARRMPHAVARATPAWRGWRAVAGLPGQGGSHRVPVLRPNRTLWLGLAGAPLRPGGWAPGCAGGPIGRLPPAG